MNLDYPNCWDDTRIPLFLLKVASELDKKDQAKWSELVRTPLVHWQHSRLGIGQAGFWNHSKSVYWSLNEADGALLSNPESCRLLKSEGIGVQITDILSRSTEKHCRNRIAYLSKNQDFQLQSQILEALGADIRAAHLCLLSEIEHWVEVYNWALKSHSANPAKAIENYGALLDVSIFMGMSITESPTSEILKLIANKLDLSARRLQQLNARGNLQLLQLSFEDRLELIQMLRLFESEKLPLSGLDIQNLLTFLRGIRSLKRTYYLDDLEVDKLLKLISRTDWLPPKGWSVGQASWEGMFGTGRRIDLSINRMPRIANYLELTSI